MTMTHKSCGYTGNYEEFVAPTETVETRIKCPKCGEVWRIKSTGLKTPGPNKTVLIKKGSK